LDTRLCGVHIFIRTSMCRVFTRTYSSTVGVYTITPLGSIGPKRHPAHPLGGVAMPSVYAPVAGVDGN
jgi:hypothetical protein